MMAVFSVYNPKGVLAAKELFNEGLFEDLMPYIPMKVKIKKWIGNLIMFPLLSALIAGGVAFFAK